MKINTTRFGELEVDENRIFDFELPIIGFNEFTKFIMLDLSKDKFFKWLQSVEEPSLAFPVVSVFSLGVDYSIDLSDDVVEKLQIDDVENLLVMNIASIPQENPQGTTLNLLAPIIFNLGNLKAGQVILSGSGYDVSFPLFKKA